ncbi:MAG TPA: hypothetical protein VIQ74_17365 [Gemmatimonadaceae bacterium]
MDRHLLPEEIDQLLDGEVGFGTAPLKSHVRSCAECRAELASARALVDELERLPRFGASVAFADTIMSRVQVFVPWHVALTDMARSWIPQQRRWRAAAWTGVASLSAVLLVASLWVVTHLDTVVFALELALQRVRAAGTATLSDVVTSLLGDTAARALSASGTAGLTVALLVAISTAVLAVGALRAVVVGARRRS